MGEVRFISLSNVRDHRRRVGVRWIAWIALFLFGEFLNQIDAGTLDFDGKIVVFYPRLPRDQKGVIKWTIFRHKRRRVERALITTITKILVNNRAVSQFNLLVFEFRSARNPGKRVLLKSPMWHTSERNAKIDWLTEDVSCKPSHFVFQSWVAIGKFYCARHCRSRNFARRGKGGFRRWFRSSGSDASRCRKQKKNGTEESHLFCEHPVV